MVDGCKHVASVLHFVTCQSLVFKESAESIGVKFEKGDMEFAGTVTLTVGVGNDSVVHKFVLVKNFVYSVFLESDFLLQMDTVLGYGKLGYCCIWQGCFCLPTYSKCANWLALSGE